MNYIPQKTRKTVSGETRRKGPPFHATQSKEICFNNSTRLLCP